MIFAAGLGTRLAPLTDACPKALLPVGGVPMLERVARRMVAAGVTRLVINVCPFADRIEAFVREKNGFGIDVVLSRESPAPLETGGGLLAARALFRSTDPLLLHNVDILSDLPLVSLLDAHRRDRPLATLAVMDRPTSRRLLFDDRGLLGRVDDAKGLRTLVRPAIGRITELAFSGVHAVAQSLLERLTETGRFSILDPYLRLAASGCVVLPFRVDGFPWIDIGRPEDLARSEALSLPG